MYYTVMITNSRDILANTISVVDKQRCDISNLDAVETIVGLPIETLNSLQKLSDSINSDSNCFYFILHAINLKSDITYVNTQFDNIITKSLKHDTRDESTIKVLTKSDKVNTYNTSEFI